MANVIIKTEECADNYYMREAYNTIRTNFLFSGCEIKTVVITSCHMSEGKSTVSSVLAQSLAEMGKKTLLVDADLRKSVFASRVEGVAAKGMSHFLSGQAELEEVLCSTQYPELDVIFAGKVPPNPVELLNSERMKNFVADMREKYDYVLIDTPPLGMVIDSAVAAEFCDGAVMVLDAGNVQSREAQDVKSQLEKSGCRLLGVVLNHTEARNGFFAECVKKIKALFKKKELPSTALKKTDENK